MITIYYHKEKQQWFHNNPSASYKWGVQEIELPFTQSISSTQAFLRLKGEKAGPIVGVLTNKAVLEKLNVKQRPLLELLHHTLQEKGGLLALFAEETMSHHFFEGYCFDGAKKQWIKTTLPLPNVIYNRYPGRKSETKKLKSLHKKIKSRHIPLFNSAFFSKWKVYQLFSKHPLLSSHLPKTYRLTPEIDIAKLLQKHSSLYFKPINSSKGAGIFRLSSDKHTIIYQDHKRKEEFSSLQAIDLPRSAYLIQEAIETQPFKDRRYDLRILAHHKDSRYVISGVGIRHSPYHSITTHTLNGGSISPSQDLEDEVDTSFLSSFVNTCGQVLQKSFPLIEEFSLDMAKSVQGHYYLFEVNAKPMIFDETDIQTQGAKHICNIFYKLTKFLD
ncbi:YheC/YheD family protein [Priestia sp. TRN 1309]|uniref:YheC/YheD family endospore coat-associated protein n=1 Tax=Priestia sp. TRN 1309 TaxID=3420729 RepID=UPI003D76DF1F